MKIPDQHSQLDGFVDGALLIQDLIEVIEALRLTGLIPRRLQTVSDPALAHARVLV